METKGAPITTLKFAYFLPAFSVSFFLTVIHSIITLTLQGPKQIRFIRLMYRLLKKLPNMLNTCTFCESRHVHNKHKPLTVSLVPCH
jgi:hypothetical protein